MKKSKIAITLTLLYLIATTAIVIYAHTCNGRWCGVVIIWPPFPWILVSEEFLDNTIFFVSAIILNSMIIYGLGCLISWAIRKHNSNR